MGQKAMKKIWRAIASPPYLYLPWAVWSYVVLCHVLLHSSTSGVLGGHLIGFDDQVRMVQVLDWVNGGGWYDRTIMRANPPEGFTTIWSRIVDIPLALVIVVAQQFVSQKIAVLVAASVVPLAELAILFGVAPYFVRPLVGKEKSRLIVLFLIFTSLLNVKYFSASGFLLGEASHHPWYVILYLSMFGAAARLAMGSFSVSPILVLGGSVALITAVGIEGYPMIAGTTAILALVAWGGRRPLVAARGGDALLCGAVGSLLLLPMHQPPANLFTVSFAEPSILGVILVSCAGIFLKFEQLVLIRIQKNKVLSAIILCAASVCVGVGLVSIFPRMLDGAAAGLSPAERKMAFATHFEARHLYAVSHGWLNFLCLVMPTVMALVAGGFAFKHAHGRRRALYFCFLGFAALGGGMSEMFSRYYHHAMTTACAWLVWLWEKAKLQIRRNKNYTLYAFGVFVALGPFWMLLLPAVEKDAPVTSQILLFPAAIQIAQDPCDSLPVANYINDHYPKETNLLVPYWLSSQFLYQTDVRVDFVANYPSQDKFIDNYKFYGTQSESDARDIVAKHHVDLVTICQYPLLYNQTFPDNLQVFVALLQLGRHPNWLKPVNMNLATNYRLYEVDKSLITQGVSP